MSLTDRLTTLLGEVGRPLVRREEPAPAPREDGAEPAAALPFEALSGLRRIENHAGSLWIIETRLFPHEAVGRVTLSRWADARLTNLALLLPEPRLRHSTPREALFVDIEATDLAGGAGCLAFLVGLGFYEPDGSFVVQQVLLEGPGDEQAALAHVAEAVEAHPLLVSFNGKSYDLTVLQSRMVIQRLMVYREAELKLTPHIDLLHCGRRLWKDVFESCRLGVLEAEILGIPRKDDLSGSEVPDYWLHYLHGGDARWLQPILAHNLQDVQSMPALLGTIVERIEHPETCLRGQPLFQIGRWFCVRGHRSRGTLMERALSAWPLPRDFRARGHLQVAIELRRMGEPERMVAHLEQACALWPEAPEPRVELAKHHEHRTRDLPEALRQTEAALQHSADAQGKLEHRRLRLLRKLGRT